MKSMTAYAQGKKVLPKGILEVNIKSLNHRAMELEFLGDGLDVLQEDGLRQFCKKMFTVEKFASPFILVAPWFWKNRNLITHCCNIFCPLNKNFWR